MASRPAPPPPPPPNGSMLTMLLVMILMSFLIINPNIRNSLGNMADPILSPILPETQFFVLTVLILGTFSMTMNTVLRNLFMDPIAQAHIAHRQGQVRRMMNDGRMSRDPILMEKANTLREQMMPEQLKVQMGAMRPMMFTMIFIIGIFAWLTTAVESFRVDYVSLPWTPRWNLLDDKFLFFPAWICAYICMSAPLGRIVDRHIKLIRYRNHPVVLANEKLSEPLLHLVVSDEGNESKQAKNRRSKSRKNGPKKQQKVAAKTQTKSEDKDASTEHVCPECMSEDVAKKGPRSLRCNVCYHEWV
jgi:uncharacterized membrane protein (DUF106 family)